jgi:hypothetical protein
VTARDAEHDQDRVRGHHDLPALPSVDDGDGRVASRPVAPRGAILTFRSTRYAGSWVRWTARRPRATV